MDRIGSHGPAVTETYLNLEKLKIKKKRGDKATESGLMKASSSIKYPSNSLNDHSF